MLRIPMGNEVLASIFLGLGKHRRVKERAKDLHPTALEVASQRQKKLAKKRNNPNQGALFSTQRTNTQTHKHAHNNIRPTDKCAKTSQDIGRSTKRLPEGCGAKDAAGRPRR